MFSSSVRSGYRTDSVALLVPFLGRVVASTSPRAPAGIQSACPSPNNTLFPSSSWFAGSSTIIGTSAVRSSNRIFGVRRCDQRPHRRHQRFPPHKTHNRIDDDAEPSQPGTPQPQENQSRPLTFANPVASATLPKMIIHTIAAQAMPFRTRPSLDRFSARTIAPLVKLYHLTFFQMLPTGPASSLPSLHVLVRWELTIARLAIKRSSLPKRRHPA